jgi:hypothetical protein
MEINTKLLNDFLKLQKEYKKQEKLIETHFKQQVQSKIKDAETIEELQEVKEFLRGMPQIVGKVLIFRDIILKEEFLQVREQIKQKTDLI